MTKVKLSQNVWKHIRERHPEMANYKDQIMDVISKPALIVEGKYNAMKAIGLVHMTHVGSKYLIVVYREEKSRKDIITAYFTSDLKRVKGEIIWKA